MQYIFYMVAMIISESDKIDLKDANVLYREAAAVTYYNGPGAFIRLLRSGRLKDSYL